MQIDMWSTLQKVALTDVGESMNITQLLLDEEMKEKDMDQSGLRSEYESEAEGRPQSEATSTTIAAENRAKRMMRDATARSKWRKRQITIRKDRLEENTQVSLRSSSFTGGNVQLVFELEHVQRKLQESYDENQELLQDAQMLVEENEEMIGEIEDLSKGKTRLEEINAELEDQLEDARHELDELKQQNNKSPSVSSSNSYASRGSNRRLSILNPSVATAIASSAFRASLGVVSARASAPTQQRSKSIAFGQTSIEWSKDDYQIAMESCKQEVSRKTRAWQAELGEMQAMLDKYVTENEELDTMARECVKNNKQLCQKIKHFKACPYCCQQLKDLEITPDPAPSMRRRMPCVFGGVSAGGKGAPSVQGNNTTTNSFVSMAQKSCESHTTIQEEARSFHSSQEEGNEEPASTIKSSYNPSAPAVGGNECGLRLPDARGSGISHHVNAGMVACPLDEQEGQSSISADGQTSSVVEASSQKGHGGAFKEHSENQAICLDRRANLVRKQDSKKYTCSLPSCSDIIAEMEDNVSAGHCTSSVSSLFGRGDGDSRSIRMDRAAAKMQDITDQVVSNQNDALHCEDFEASATSFFSSNEEPLPILRLSLTDDYGRDDEEEPLRGIGCKKKTVSCHERYEDVDLGDEHDTKAVQEETCKGRVTAENDDSRPHSGNNKDK
jgi:hypothetical protein